MFRKLVAASAVAAITLWPSVAFAHSCINASRPPCDTSGSPLFSEPEGNGSFFNVYATEGTWACFTITVGSPAPAGHVVFGPYWGDSQPATGSLLANSSHCTKPSLTDNKTYNGDPSTWRGIQSGCEG